MKPTIIHLYLKTTVNDLPYSEKLETNSNFGTIRESARSDCFSITQIYIVSKKFAKSTTLRFLN
jgi:hypothetical protein